MSGTASEEPTMGVVEKGLTCEKCHCTFTGTPGQRICGRPSCQDWLLQFVRPLEIYQPAGLIATRWFKRYAVCCGGCSRDFHRFRIFPITTWMPLICPYCRAKNVPEFSQVG